MTGLTRSSFFWLLLAGVAVACGARDGVHAPYGPTPATTGGSGGTASMGGGGQGGEGGELPPCVAGETLLCGIEVGECERGKRICENGEFGECQGAIGPIAELCNTLDDDCDGAIDNGFGLGQACDGPDSDLCLDDLVICGGCSAGTDNLESCNGVDDNCNSIIDADCDFGDCQPKLTVTGSTPSNPNCIDFPVQAGSTGSIQYPCTGGMVSAMLGDISFSGSVTNGQVSLFGTEQQEGPDECMWQMDHYIKGSIPSGTLQYSYAETLLTPLPKCWMPCTEVGTVKIDW